MSLARVTGTRGMIDLQTIPINRDDSRSLTGRHATIAVPPKGRNHPLRWCLFSLLCVVIAACGREEAPPPMQAVTDAVPVQEGWNSRIFISRAGLLQAVVWYGYMVKYENKDIIFFDQGVEVDFYDAGNHTSHLISQRGEYNEKTEDVTGIGLVRVLSDSGATLNTEVLHWDNKNGRVYSDTLVMVTTQDGDTLYGVGFESNADLTRRVIRKPWGRTKRSVDIDNFKKNFDKPAGRDSVEIHEEPDPGR